MSKTLIQDIVTLTKEGWRPYNAQPEGFVYERLRCRPFLRGKKGYWFVRGDVFLCVGCAARCCLNRPNGFPAPLPIKYEYTPETPYTLTPVEMAHRLDLLRVPQAAYCLNISERLVYDWIACGKLIKVKDEPIRVRAKEIRELQGSFDE